MLKERDERGGYIVPQHREETTLQRLNRCRAVLRMHGVLSHAENRRVLERIVGNYSPPLAASLDEETPAK